MKNILLIDDDEIIQKILLKILLQKGYNTVYGVDGRDGLSKIDLMHYDLIITDIMMPYLNGFELIQEFKKHDNTKDAKLIVISSIAQEASMLDAMNVEIDLFIPKPIVIDQFIQAIQKLLN